jgi:NTP pyrophosphatase (non-canonical NTP hydrolase)
MTYYLYHIPGKKIGVTRDLKCRVEKQQGYGPGEYSILMKSDSIEHISGALSPTGVNERCDNPDCKCLNPTHFDLIRFWAKDRGLYDGGDPKTQALKLVEEVGETCRAILKEDAKEMIDGIGDCVVVLTNLAELIGTPIEDCIDKAYNEIKGRKGKMSNGTYVKHE